MHSQQKQPVLHEIKIASFSLKAFLLSSEKRLQLGKMYEYSIFWSPMFIFITQEQKLLFAENSSVLRFWTNKNYSPLQSICLLGYMVSLSLQLLNCFLHLSLDCLSDNPPCFNQKINKSYIRLVQRCILIWCCNKDLGCPMYPLGGFVKELILVIIRSYSFVILKFYQLSLFCIINF